MTPRDGVRAGATGGIIAVTAGGGGCAAASPRRSAPMEV